MQTINIIYIVCVIPSIRNIELVVTPFGHEFVVGFGKQETKSDFNTILYF